MKKTNITKIGKLRFSIRKLKVRILVYSNMREAYKTINKGGLCATKKAMALCANASEYIINNFGLTNSEAKTLHLFLTPKVVKKYRRSLASDEMKRFELMDFISVPKEIKLCTIETIYQMQKGMLDGLQMNTKKKKGIKK